MKSGWLWGGIGVTAMVTLVLTVAVLASTRAAPTPDDDRPRYTADGRLIPPPDYREWVFLSAGFDMSYADRAEAPDTHVFDNVFAAPAAYRAFQRTGHWPDGTVLILENRAGRGPGSINRAGHFQTGVVGLEAHVRDETRFAGGWGFFVFEDGAAAEVLARDAPCYTCHEAHAAVDTTFVQFYPTLLDTAERLRTTRSGFSFDAARPAG